MKMLAQIKEYFKDRGEASLLRKLTIISHRGLKIVHERPHHHRALSTPCARTGAVAVLALARTHAW